MPGHVLANEGLGSGSAGSISAVENMIVAVPLDESLRVSGDRTVARRIFNVVRLTTETGLMGVGYAAGGQLIHSAIEHELAPSLLGADPFATEALWAAAYERTGLIGRVGAVLRALSAVDIALWDLKAKAVGLSLARLLGAAEATTVPVYATCGYYRDGRGLEDLSAEIAGYVEAGFRAVKLKFGNLEWRDDVARVAAVRRAVGDEVEIAVDANGAYRSGAHAIRVGRALEQLGVRWFEEPLGPESIGGLVEVAAALDMPIAFGEGEATRWQFRDLIDRGGFDVLQPDVTVVGGISEWIKVAALATSAGLPIAPHFFPEVHAQLAAATPGAFTIEYIPAELGNFDRLLREPVRFRDGVVAVSETPGVGLELDDDAVAQHRVV